MITPILFLDQSYIIRFSQVNGTLDQKWVEPVIWLAQKKHLLPILGKCLYEKYEELISHYLQDSATGLGLAENAEYKTVLDNYILDVLMHWTLVELYPHLWIKIDNAALLHHVKEDSESLAEKEVYRMVGREKSNALMFSDRLIKVLCDSDLDEYHNCDECQEKIVKTKSLQGLVVV